MGMDAIKTDINIAVMINAEATESIIKIVDGLIIADESILSPADIAPIADAQMMQDIGIAAKNNSIASIIYCRTITGLERPIDK